MFKKFITTMMLVSLVFIPSFGVSAQEDDSLSRVEDRGHLIAAISGTLYPSGYYNEDNELVGYNVDIIREVADRLGLEVEFMEMGVDGMLTSAKSGQVDLVVEGVQPTKKRKEDFLIGEPIKYSFTSIVVREEDNSGIESIEDFAGKKAAGGATTNYMQIASQLGAELVTYDNATNDQYFLDVGSGRTDFIPNDYYLQKTSIDFFSDLGVKLGNVFYNPSFSAFVYNSESHALQEAIDEVLLDMKEDGTLAKISATYFNGEDVSVQQEEINGIKIDDLPVIELEENE
ncbi:transporter substrate-binding domain-containing protein [Aerococcaceae bacterium WGS1372]